MIFTISMHSSIDEPWGWMYDTHKKISVYEAIIMAERVFAFTGKGGVGKTSMSALTVRLLAERHPDKRVLAIDADPAIGLATALGVNVTQTVNDVRLQFIKDLQKPNKPSALEVMQEAHYEVMDTVVDCGNFCFMAIGRPEGAGCYCSVNSFLKEIIAQLTDNFDYVVIDGEAGIEQVNRRVMETVTDLILISDSSKKGIDVIKTIKGVASSLDMYSRDYVVINRVRNEKVLELIDLEGMKLAGFIPEDDDLELLDIRGESLVKLSKDSVTVKKMAEILAGMGC